jgi:hypothetical protein
VDESQPSERVVDQRIRNRIIEYFELAASNDDQLAYEKNVPIAHVPYEVINQWEDWVPAGPSKAVNDPSVFSAAELQEMQDFQLVWESTAAAVPDDYPHLSDVQALPAWDQLRQQAKRALRVFEVRGKLPEDREAEG